MNVKVKMNKTALRKLSQAQLLALEQTAEAVKTDVIAENVLPFDSGTMQNESMAIDVALRRQGKLTIAIDTPYARKIYFHPEYKFDQSKNPNAKGRWFDDWISGRKKDFAIKAYRKLYKKLTGV